MSVLRRVYSRLAVSPNPFLFDPRLDRLVEDLCSSREPGQWVLNVGSGTTKYGPQTINLDIEIREGVQVRADGQRLPCRDSSLSGVLLRGVLEHVRSAEVLRSEVIRALKPRGFVYVEVPFLQPFHLSPEDHRRFTLPGLRCFLADFEEIESGVQVGPGSTLAWVVRETVASLASFGSERAYRRTLAITGWATFWLRYLDRLIVPAPHVAHSASALYFLGRKSG